MTEALVAHDPSLAQPLKPEQLQARLKLIQDVMRTVMKKDEDYGTIPGTKNPTLYKPGAEKILVTLRLTAGHPIVEDLSDADVIRYRVKVPIETTTGVSLGMGVGECSSNEEKYKWRRPVYGSKEFDDTPADRRREVWKKFGNKPAEKIKQVRTEPSDVANTILKMAHKRALVHGTLLATAAGSVFSQDLEDVPDEVREDWVESEKARTPSEPQRKPAPASPPVSAEAAQASAPAASVESSSGPAMTTGVRIVETKFVEDKKAGNYYEVIGKKGVNQVAFVTKDQEVYAQAASCEGTDHLFTLTYTRGKNAGKPALILTGITIEEADDATPNTNGALFGGGGGNA